MTKARCSKIHIDQFKKEVKLMSKQTKREMTNELFRLCEEQLYAKNKSLPPRWNTSYGHIKRRWFNRYKSSINEMCVLYLIAYYDKDELTHWFKEGAKLFRVRDPEKYMRDKQANIIAKKRKKRERDSLNADHGFIRKAELTKSGKPSTVFHVYREKQNWY